MDGALLSNPVSTPRLADKRAGELLRPDGASHKAASEPKVVLRLAGDNQVLNKAAGDNPDHNKAVDTQDLNKAGDNQVLRAASEPKEVPKVDGAKVLLEDHRVDGVPKVKAKEAGADNQAIV